MNFGINIGKKNKIKNGDIMGKGSSPRPFTDRQKFEDEFDRIFRKNKNETMESNKAKPAIPDRKNK